MLLGVLYFCDEGRYGRPVLVPDNSKLKNIKLKVSER